MLVPGWILLFFVHKEVPNTIDIIPAHGEQIESLLSQSEDRESSEAGSVFKVM